MPESFAVLKSNEYSNLGVFSTETEPLLVRVCVFLRCLQMCPTPPVGKPSLIQ